MIKLPKKITHYVTPGHGYLKVPMTLIKKYGLCKKISSYSFKSKTFAFLEEDCDAPLFLKTLEKMGTRHHYEIDAKYVEKACCVNYARFENKFGG